jgi:tetratricopeptide (TPR) repeat protein
MWGDTLIVFRGTRFAVSRRSNVPHILRDITAQEGRSWIPALASLLFLLVPITFAQNSQPNFDEAVLNATAAREQNDIPRAIELYSKAVQLNPKWADGWWFLGSLQYSVSNYSGARDSLTRYIELMPKAGPAIAMRGLCEFEIAEYKASLDDIQHGLLTGAANQPRNEKILRFHEAMLLTHEARFEDALHEYSSLAQFPNPEPEMIAGFGLAGLRTALLPRDILAGQRDVFLAAGQATYQFMAGHENDALPEFQALFRNFPSTPNAHYLLGYLLFATDPDQAVAEFKRELELNPTNAPARVMLAWASLLQNNPSDALPLAQSAVTDSPAIPGAQVVLGRALMETGDLKNGIDYLEKARQLEPDNLEVHLALAKAYSKSGRKDDARHERMLCLQLTHGGTQAAHP